MADWLNVAFEKFDYAILEFGHNLHISAGSFFDGFFKYFTHLGDAGLFVILIGLLLICFKNTRKIGLSMVGAVVIGALFTNIIIKPLVARPRPYADETRIFYQWWLDVGMEMESDFSFPSGHTTAVTSAMMGFFLAGNKKYSWTGFLFAILMGFSRIYLCVHYPSDVLFGFIIGIIAGSLSYLCVWLLYKYTANTKFGDFVNNKDAITLYQYICKKSRDKKYNAPPKCTDSGEKENNKNNDNTNIKD